MFVFVVSPDESVFFPETSDQLCSVWILLLRPATPILTCFILLSGSSYSHQSQPILPRCAQLSSQWRRMYSQWISSFLFPSSPTQYPVYVSFTTAICLVCNKVLFLGSLSLLAFMGLNTLCNYDFRFCGCGGRGMKPWQNCSHFPISHSISGEALTEGSGNLMKLDNTVVIHKLGK